MALAGFHRPLQRKGYSNRYSSENARQWNRISVRGRMERDVHVQVLLQQIKNARDETDDELAQLRHRAVRRSVLACFLYALRWTAHDGPAKDLRQFFGGEKSMWSRACRYAHIIDL